MRRGVLAAVWRSIPVRSNRWACIQAARHRNCGASCSVSGPFSALRVPPHRCIQSTPRPVREDKRGFLTFAHTVSYVVVWRRREYRTDQLELQRAQQRGTRGNERGRGRAGPNAGCTRKCRPVGHRRRGCRECAGSQGLEFGAAACGSSRANEPACAGPEV